jgi:hypothetical protein
MAIADERVSRRRLLKRAGIGAAAVGAGSMLTATTASAVAHGSGVCVGLGSCGPCLGNFCDANCTCLINTEGCCFCHNSISCSHFWACDSSSDCPPGWQCAETCCGGPHCVPHCGAFVGNALAGGPTSTGGGHAADGGGGGHHEEAPAHGGHGHQ